MKYLVLIFALALAGCTGVAKDAVDNAENWYGEIVPDGAENVRYVGDEWIVFDWTPPEGKKGTFIVRWGRDRNTSFAVTQLSGDTEDNPVAVETPEGKCPICGSVLKFTPLGPVHVE